MICLRCGYCCLTSCVIIVDDPEKGIQEDNNLILQNGLEKRCKHLRGDSSGEYSCAIHDKTWYKETPCFSHGQIESSTDTPCRMGVYILNKKSPGGVMA